MVSLQVLREQNEHTRFARQREARGDNMGGWVLNLRDSAHFERGLFGVIGEQMPVLLGAVLVN